MMRLFPAPTYQVSHSKSIGDARLGFLDALRGLAALAVCIAHSGERLSPWYYAFQDSGFHLGNFGVVLFFLVSGFIIPVSLERQGSLRRFWVQRLCRLYPLYWVSLAGTLGLSGWEVGPTQDAAEFSIGTIVANVFMLQTFLGYPHVLGVYWTLVYELLFYMVMSVAFVCNVHTRTITNTLILVLTVLFSYLVLPLTPIGLVFPVDLLFYLATMFVGSVCYRMYVGTVPSRHGLVLFLLAISMVIITPHPGQMYARAVAYLLFGVALYLRAVTWCRSLQWLGKISYSLYLLHAFVLSLVPTVGSPIITILIWLTVLLPLCAFTEYVIERPGIGLGRWLSKKMERRQGHDPNQHHRVAGAVDTVSVTSA